jgi:copper chaperone
MNETLQIEGMSCHHCVMAVEGLLRNVAGVDVRRVVIGEAEVAYDPAQVSRQALVVAIEEEGYRVRAADEQAA